MTTQEPSGDANGTSATPALGPGHANTPVHGRALGLLGLSALGVVYGDIGTSPLYALRECFHGIVPLAVTRANVLGVLSLIFWSLILVVTVKYLVYVLRADNNGEGGILALMALLDPWRERIRDDRRVVIALGVFGAALLYGDGMITPAISVLSAVEGLEVAAPILDRAVIPLTIVVLILLFAIQRRGTERVGRVFGPIMLLWFAVLAVLGIGGIVRHPAVLAAVDPLHAVRFFALNGRTGFLVLGAVFLVVTGGEALYADVGHFGTRPIRLAWFTVVLPGLLLNYFGQGALILARPAEALHPFYHLAPAWATYPLVGLATVATVIASQAIISGAFSLTRQAVQLGESPRLTIEQTSADEIGQIYIPAVNWALMLATIALVLGFRTSSRLAAAYGVAVVTTMVITTLLAYNVARERWGWSRLTAGLVTAGFLAIDLAFFAANLDKIPDGGWFPLVAAAGVFILMSTWKRGKRLLAERLKAAERPLEDLLDEIAAHPPVRVEGTAVFMTGRREGTPPMLLHHLEHNKVLHETAVLLTVTTEEVPRVPPSERLEVEELSGGFWRVLVHYGFMESPDLPRALRGSGRLGLELDLDETTFYLGRETLLPTPDFGMAVWRERLFAFMARNAARATAFFRIPPERVVELGMQVEI
jgi:KUP system potassium uptake protein